MRSNSSLPIPGAAFLPREKSEEVGSDQQRKMEYRMSEFPTTYDHRSVEDKIYATWEKNNLNTATAIQIAQSNIGLMIFWDK